MSSVFISYARADDESFVQRIHTDLIVNGFTVWWDRAAMESRGRTFLQEIRDAISVVDRVLLVVGPSALQSDYVRVEWEYALEACKIVIPILRLGDHLSVPRPLGKLHCPDFRVERPYDDALAELLRLMGKPVPTLGLLIGVDGLPQHFLPRQEAIDHLKQIVLADADQPTVITSAKQTLSLQGMGGVGKSVLASAFARACETRRAFGDGIIWLKLGQEPNLIEQMRLVAQTFGDDLQHYLDLNSSKARLAHVLHTKTCLIVLDDVWDITHAEAFLTALDTRCRLIITTRDGGLASAISAQEYRLDILTDQHALTLLAAWAELSVAQLPAQAIAVADECGNLPFALALCGAMIRDGNLWADLLAALREADLTFLERRFPNYPYPNVLKSLDVSVLALERVDPIGAQHYREMAVFPKGTAVPEVAVLTLWQRDHTLTDRDARKLLVTLERKALLRLEGTAPHRHVSLHDLQHDYLRASQPDLPSLHRALLAAYYQQCADGWPSGPNDGYFFQQLSRHLVEAGHQEDLRALLLNFDWLWAKLAATDITALIADYDLLPDDRDLWLVSSALRLAAHILAEDQTQLAGQLIGRLLSYVEVPRRRLSRRRRLPQGIGHLLPHVREPSIQALLAQVQRWEVRPWIQPLTASLTSPGGALMRTLKGHTNWVLAVAVTPDGRHVISGSQDGTLKVWNLATGVEERTLKGHSDSVNAVVVTSDGRRVISGSDDGTLKVWNLATGVEERTLKVQDTDSKDENHKPHWFESRVKAMALVPSDRYVVAANGGELKIWDLTTGDVAHTIKDESAVIDVLTVLPDGQRLIFNSYDDTLIVWNLDADVAERTLKGHTRTVTSVAVTADGRHAVSASYDDLIVWDLHSGAIQHKHRYNHDLIWTVSVTPDGRRVVSGSSDSTLQIWDLPTGMEERTLEGHTGKVTAVAVTPDGKRIVSASWDHTVNVWNLYGVEAEHELDGHTGWVTAITVTPDQRHAISVSHDNTLKMWDLATGRAVRTLKAGTGALTDLIFTGVAVTPDGRHAVTASHSYLQVWDLHQGVEVPIVKPFVKDPTAVAMTIEGWYMVSKPDLSGQVIVSRLAAGWREISLKHHSIVEAVTVTPDGQHAVSVSRERTLKIWDLATGVAQRTLELRTKGIKEVAMTPDGRHVVVGCSDGMLEVWDLMTETLERTLEGHTDVVYAVAVTPDGKHVVSTSQDRTLIVWKFDSGTVVAYFNADRGMSACTITQDGTMIIAGDQSGRIHFLGLRGHGKVSDSVGPDPPTRHQ